MYMYNYCIVKIVMWLAKECYEINQIHVAGTHFLIAFPSHSPLYLENQFVLKIIIQRSLPSAWLQ